MAINASKCVFGQASVKYLGQEISAAGVRPLPSKLQSIIEVPRPNTKVELQRYLGMVNFYHRFLPGIAASLCALHSLVAAAKTAKTKLVWDEAAVSSYERSKEKLFSPVLLAHPRPGMRLKLTTDASDIAIGAVLAQEDGRPLGFFSLGSFPMRRENIPRLTKSSLGSRSQFSTSVTW